MTSMQESEAQPLFAFLLVLGAGLSTALGASVVFFPQLVKLASRRVLAGSLGLSAGVMTYVSFIEIFQKSVGSFEDAGHEKFAYCYATLCFFGGVVVMLILDLFVKKVTGTEHHHLVPHQSDNCSNKDSIVEVVVPHCIGCIDDPVAELESWQGVAENERQARQRLNEDGKFTTDCNVSSSNSLESKGENDDDDDIEEQNNADNDATTNGDKNETTSTTPKKEDHENKKLVKMGLTTALAIGLHNFPEGLATFIAALNDPKVGAVLAIAIGIHNIPEGLCVSLPIYYATGNRLKGFLWALLSGLSEPVAALLGWLVLANHFTDEAFAILFGLVAGMMVMISARELLPTAHQYDPNDTVVSYSFIVGMGIMAVSLVLFTL